MYSWQLCHPHLMVALLQAVARRRPQSRVRGGCGHLQELDSMSPVGPFQLGM